MNRAWSRSVEDAGSMVTNSMCVKSSSGSSWRGDCLLGLPERVLGEGPRQFQRRAQRVERLGKLVLLLVDARGQAMMGHENQISSICAISLGS